MEKKKELPGFYCTQIPALCGNMGAFGVWGMASPSIALHLQKFR